MEDFRMGMFFGALAALGMYGISTISDLNFVLMTVFFIGFQSIHLLLAIYREYKNDLMRRSK